MIATATMQREFVDTAAAPVESREFLLAGEEIKIAARGLNFFYDEHQALFDNDLKIAANRVTPP